MIIRNDPNKVYTNNCRMPKKVYTNNCRTPNKVYMRIKDFTRPIVNKKNERKRIFLPGCRDEICAEVLLRNKRFKGLQGGQGTGE